MIADCLCKQENLYIPSDDTEGESDHHDIMDEIQHEDQDEDENDEEGSTYSETHSGSNNTMVKLFSSDSLDSESDSDRYYPSSEHSMLALTET